MLFAVLFEDNADRAEVRARQMPEHLAFLERHAGSIRAAGPLLDTADRSPAGGLWLVDADDAASVGALYREDPFWPTGLRRSVRVLEWRQVFRDGQGVVPDGRESQADRRA
jgi:hypothetical protein